MNGISSAALAALSCILLTGVAPAQETNRFYRVEVIVFTHAAGQPDNWPSEKIENFSALTDPLANADQARHRSEDDDAAEDDDIQAALELLDTLEELETISPLIPDALRLPEPWIALDTLSAPMARAWDRFSASAEYRPRVWMAWHQPLTAGARFTPVRVHDDAVIGVDWIGLRPDGIPTRDGRPARSARALMPRMQYRLDGSIRLRQRQFMHLDARLHWRAPATVGPAPAIQRFGRSRQFQVHRLEQSRTIRPERLEYFDSDWLGLLVRVVPVIPDDEEASGDNGTDDKPAPDPGGN